MIQLREYQIELINNIDNALLEGNNYILVTAAPSAGKTIIYGRLLTILKAVNAMIVVPANELKEQVTLEMAKMGVTNVEVETIQKLMHEPPREVDVLILDEGHRYQAPVWGRITERITATYVIGLTATPYRSDHKPLLKENGGFFECLVEGPTIKELTEEGYIADIAYYTSPVRQIVKHLQVRSRIDGVLLGTIKDCISEPLDLSEDVVNQYHENFAGLSGISFCSSVKHCKAVASDFNDAGVSAVAITQEVSKRECSELLNQFRQGDLKMITVCRKLNDGFNAPNAKVALFVKDFKSLGGYIQAIGRVIRLNGQIAHVVDLCGNFYRFGRVDEAEQAGKLITV